ncbi:GCN5-related protein N-acetyltransferase [Beutenbergia cavernae DSM 12333]|uniref:GCN5-related protein N-acetyltransferase n=1 Tax=Beutenbergia cavernae (strain ATCC BAA-8 / DSM 12333 / CCUG 43141 / JCM 11478 / NBRC 16432 / NCIMB 13614 / HKI 0122) TaxID=471853 RepID=C5BW49_BEUC1|nr:GNAT family N-acetyltransferase [Beutenbergia cavernae]ACQ80650.1 GCN5-related protein N-acetyltransferase [Beutenbergia cavernae DSM 12333]
MSAPTVRVLRVTDDAMLRRALALRHDVFVREQGVPIELEHDADDDAPTTTHVLACGSDDEVLGTGRLLADPDRPGVVHVGRIAVAASARGLGVGAVLMAALEGLALADHGVPDGERLTVRVELAAQERAVGFYARLGYAVADEVFLDAGIRHREAVRVLTI